MRESFKWGGLKRWIVLIILEKIGTVKKAVCDIVLLMIPHTVIETYLILLLKYLSVSLIQITIYLFLTKLIISSKVNAVYSQPYLLCFHSISRLVIDFTPIVHGL